MLAVNWKKLFISFSYLLFLPLTIVSCFDSKTGNVQSENVIPQSKDHRNSEKQNLQDQGKTNSLENQSKDSRENSENNVPATSADSLSDEEFRAANQRSLKINISGLSELDPNAKVQDIGFQHTFPSNKGQNSFEPFKIETHTGIKKENDTVFLGQKNEGLNIYLLDRLSKDNIKTNSQVKHSFNSYFNPDFTKGVQPKYFGFKSLDYDDTRYLQAYQRNIRFAPGTAILLDSKEDESVFLTNAHVLYTNGILPFWEKMTYPFMRFYYNNKVNDLGTLEYSGILSLFLLKQAYDKNQASHVDLQDPYKRQQSSNKLYKRYFRLARNFNNQRKDLGIFYFNHSNFSHDVEAVLEFYDKNRESLLTTFPFLNSESIDKRILEFKSQFKIFQQFWEHAKKFPPLKIAERIWKDDEVDFTTKIAGFWPQAAFAKNMFKGVWIDHGAPLFFATNGHGASGGGIFNTNGELVFINQSIALGKDQQKLYYDQYNLTSHLTFGILFRDGKSDLVNEIKKFYYKNQEKATADAEKQGGVQKSTLQNATVVSVNNFAYNSVFKR
ncbi:hypothetical protein MFC_01290 [Mesomycoplasma flocculare ATCC 27716]|nr:hypothetical protein MFC_01290 [Mesomycoplasma flocculare ATCC 27716]